MYEINNVSKVMLPILDFLVDNLLVLGDGKKANISKNSII